MVSLLKYPLLFFEQKIEGLKNNFSKKVKPFKSISPPIFVGLKSEVFAFYFIIILYFLSASFIFKDMLKIIDNQLITADTIAAVSLIEEKPLTISNEKNQLINEALLWLSVLKNKEEEELTNKELAGKFKNMTIACNILGMTADGVMTKRFWSEEAVRYGKISQGILTGMTADKNSFHLSEINTRLLIAMGQNHFAEGKISKEELSHQFKKISPLFLVRSGFCNNDLLMKMHQKQIIQLPSQIWQKEL